MSRIHRRFMKLVVSAGILGAGILPGTCTMQVRDAAVNGFSAFVGDAVTAVLDAMVPLDALLGGG